MKQLILFAALFMATNTIKSQENIISKNNIKIEDRKMTPESLWAMGRIGSYVVSPDAKHIVYQVGYYSVEQNKSHQVLYIVDIDGKNKKLLTLSKNNETDPQWIENGKKIAYLCDGQIWAMNTDGSSKTKISRSDVDIEGFSFSPDEKKVILIKSINYYGSIQQKPSDLPKASGRVVNDLNYRHWDHYVESIPHPFIAGVSCDTIEVAGGDGPQFEISINNDAVDILDGEPFECPLAPFGGIEQLSWSPDSKKIAYSCKKSEGAKYAISTDSDIYIYDLITKQTINICKPSGYIEPIFDPTKSMALQEINKLDEDCNVGYDAMPKFSPDGKQIAWLSMARCGYESDRNRLCVYTFATKEKKYITESFDSNVDDYVWSDTKDAKFYFIGVWHAVENIYSVNSKGELKQVTDFCADFGSLKMVGNNKQIIAERHDYFNPADIYCVTPTKDKTKTITTQITNENGHIMEQLDKGTCEEHWVKTTDGGNMLYWAILPPNFDPNKKYPTLLFCEGGPQSPVSQFWSYRWNFMIMTAQGYVVIAPNRHGLPGFGTKWNEQVSGDWTGQCMNDYLTAIDDACQKLSYVDKDRLGCVGASFGGFSVYYLAGHHNKRFKAFISHDGAFNLESMYTDTEEGWFSNWEYEDAYWNKDISINAQKTYANSPHRFVDKWDTPILCIQGEKDYRINTNQGLGAFNAAKLKGVPAQLLVFPDENHWVLKPQNGILWQRTYFNWLDKWLKK